MKQELSKREKILIYSTALLVLFYLAIQFAVLPLLSRYNEGVRERDRLTAERMTIQFDIANKTTTIENHRVAIEQLDAIKQEYPLLVYNEEIDVILTGLCTANNLTTTSLRFSDPISIYADTADGVRMPVLTVVNVAMSVDGNFVSLMRLIDAVDDIQYMRIVNMSYSETRGVDNNILGSIVLTFELIFVNP